VPIEQLPKSPAGTVDCRGVTTFGQ
jgi:hypothetical protein